MESAYHLFILWATPEVRATGLEHVSEQTHPGIFVCGGEGVRLQKTAGGPKNPSKCQCCASASL
jgi:hypothetical protein